MCVRKDKSQKHNNERKSKLQKVTEYNTPNLKLKSHTKQYIVLVTFIHTHTIHKLNIYTIIKVLPFFFNSCTPNSGQQ